MRLVRVAVLLLACVALALPGARPAKAQTDAKPNILFIIMDDVGIDQMESLGYGGETTPSMPNIGKMADGGIRFRNTWSMPACSTSRAVFF